MSKRWRLAGIPGRQCEKYRHDGNAPCLVDLTQVKGTSSGSSYRGGSSPARQNPSVFSISSARLISDAPSRFFPSTWPFQEMNPPQSYTSNSAQWACVWYRLAIKSM